VVTVEGPVEAEVSESGVKPFCVGQGRFHEDVEILREPRLRVHRDCVAPNQNEASAVREKHG
jgi:hypothetical protein